MTFGLSLNASTRRRVNAAPCAVVALVVACTLSPASAPVRAQARSDFEIRTLSTHSDTIAGGDVLIQVGMPSAAASGQVSITLNGQDVKPAFHAGQAPNTLVGLVTGLQVGKNQLEVLSGGKSQRKATLVNYPISGPVISGSHQTPFLCETEAFGLGPSLDADCTAKTRVDYFYHSNAPAPARRGNAPPAAARGAAAPARGAAAEAPADGLGADGGNSAAANPWKPYDPAAPRPADLAMTTTTDGKTVPYIVRREMGTINRAVYVIAFLHEPGQPLPVPGGATGSWNGKLIYAFGGGCGAGYRQGASVGGLTTNRNFLEDGQLGDHGIATGYAMAGGSLNVYGTSCADLISAETMMMVKEHFIEEFGVPRYTVGSGRGLDPISWTSSERRIRWPEWDQAKRDGGPGDSSPTSSGRAPYAWFWMTARRSGPSPATWI